MELSQTLSGILCQEDCGPTCKLPKEIRSKSEFVYWFQKGIFGNKTQNWDTYDEFQQSGYQGLVHIRNRIAGAKTWYNVPACDVFYEMRQIIAHGEAEEKNLYLAAMAPTAETTFQGEVFRSEQGLAVYYSTVPKPMRESLAEGGKQIMGLTAKLFLEHYLDLVDYDWIQELLDRYDGHIVEFSVYNTRCGTLNRRCIIWECRLY
jgi:hypothetical protein